MNWPYQLPPPKETIGIAAAIIVLAIIGTYGLPKDRLEDHELRILARLEVCSGAAGGACLP